MPPTQAPYHFTMPIRVRDYEIDSQGIVNNAIYLHYLEITRHDFCEAAGTSFLALQQRGLDPVVRRIDIEYFNPLRMGQTMTSSLRLRREGPRFLFEQDIFRAGDGAPVVKAVVTVVCLNGGRLDRGDLLAAEFKQYLQPGAAL